MTRLFTLSHVTFGYDRERPAIRDLSMEVDSDETLLLAGANGSGKTTLLKILDGLLFPSAGEVSFEGQLLTRSRLDDRGFNRFFRQRVALLFQNPEVQLFHPTVAEDVAFGPVQLGLGPAEVKQRVEDVLRLMAVERLAPASVLDLSEGEKQRVALATVLAVNPDVLLLDEPIAALDPKATRLTCELIASLKAAGKTIVVATHDLDRFRMLADRVVVLGTNGSVLAGGPAAEVLGDLALLEQADLV